MTVFRRKDGRWQATVCLGGRRKAFYGKTAAQARRKAEEFLRQLGGRPMPEPGRKTVRDLLEAFLRSADLRPRTRADYEDVARKHLQPLMPRRLQDIEPLDVLGVLHGLPPRTALKVYRLLHRLFGFAVQLGHRLDNPLDRVPVPRYSPARRKLWSPEEAGRFLEVAREHPLGPLFLLLATAGLRISEALSLTWADVDLARGTVTVRRTVHRVRGAWVYSPPKTRSGQRTVSLPREVTEHLRRTRLAAVQQALRSGSGFSDENLVFSRDGVTPLHRRHVLRVMRSVCRRAGVPHVGLHALRHLHASSLLARGVSLPEVSARLGHAKTHITAQVYAHVLNRDDRRLAELAAEALGLAQPS